MGKTVKLEIFSDYVWPFCSLAEPAVEGLKRADSGVEIVWKAFELRPEPVPTFDPAGAYLTRVRQSSVNPLADWMGVTMRLPPVQPRSRRAHEAARWARLLGRFDDYNAVAFGAFFERGEDIGWVEVLLKLAADVGLDSAGLQAALERREFEVGVIADKREAAEPGVSGVPDFVDDRRLAPSGVQSPEGPRELVRRARALRG